MRKRLRVLSMALMTFGWFFFPGTRAEALLALNASMSEAATVMREVDRICNVLDALYSSALYLQVEDSKNTDGENTAISRVLMATSSQNAASAMTDALSVVGEAISPTFPSIRMGHVMTNTNDAMVRFVFLTTGLRGLAMYLPEDIDRERLRKSSYAIPAVVVTFRLDIDDFNSNPYRDRILEKLQLRWPTLIEDGGDIFFSVLPDSTHLPMIMTRTLRLWLAENGISL